jgi:hypothetical protein
MWLELAQDHVRCWAPVLVVLNPVNMIRSSEKESACITFNGSRYIGICVRELQKTTEILNLGQ